MTKRLSAVAAMFVALTLTGCGSDPAPPAAAPAGDRAGPAFAFSSATIELPADERPLPPGPHVDLVVQNCTACHSPAMILTQPRLSAEQWAATVKKMREVYRAPVSDKDVPPILAYLSALPERPASEAP